MRKIFWNFDFKEKFKACTVKFQKICKLSASGFNRLRIRAFFFCLTCFVPFHRIHQFFLSANSVRNLYTSSLSGKSDLHVLNGNCLSSFTSSMYYICLWSYFILASYVDAVNYLSPTEWDWIWYRWTKWSRINKRHHGIQLHLSAFTCVLMLYGYNGFSYDVQCYCYWIKCEWLVYLMQQDKDNVYFVFAPDSLASSNLYSCLGTCIYTPKPHADSIHVWVYLLAGYASCCLPPHAFLIYSSRAPLSGHTDLRVLCPALVQGWH